MPHRSDYILVDLYNLPVGKLQRNMKHLRLTLIMVLQSGQPIVSDAALSFDGNRKAVLITDTKFANCIRVFLSCPNTKESTVHIECTKQENTLSIPPLPYDFVIEKPVDKREILRFVPKKDGRWSVWYTYSYKIGIPSSKQPIDYVYSLPYSKTEHFMVTQGSLGAFSHFEGSQNEHAVDIRMPVGTKILAARPGTVVSFRSDSNRGGLDKDFKSWENFIVIKHEDGTYAHYLHLKTAGVQVKLGQKVKEGQPIGLSGATGLASEPHLHFGICRVKSATEMVSLPFRMKTNKGIVPRMMKGEIY